MPLPRIAITLGDAAGVGPEVVARTLGDPSLYLLCRPLVLGRAEDLARVCEVVGSSLRVEMASCPAEAGARPRIAEVWEPDGLPLARPPYGVLDPAQGAGVAACLREAMRLASEGTIQGLVTAPMNKEGFRLAGYDYADELTYLADLSGATGTAIMGVMRGLWVGTVAEHVPFRAIADLVTRRNVGWHLRLLHTMVVRATGARRPRLAVAALNVHGGEGGLVGREEVDEIAPAIAEAQAAGMDAVGPIPADTVFPRALAGEFAGVLAMYHDQANIARKLQPMGERATIFAGLMIPAGTTAHGTGYDIAGQGVADAGSLRCALETVIALANG